MNEPKGPAALVLSGGGSKGAYQAGAIWQLAQARQLDYDIYAGVSVGALNAGFLAMFPQERATLAAEGLKKIWDTIRTADVRKRHFPFGKLHGLCKTSFYNSTPLQAFVRDALDQERIRSSGKLLRVEAVSLRSGRIRSFDEQHDGIVDAILASAAFPAMLEPIPLAEDKRRALHTDGGIRNVTPLKAAIEAGAKRIDVILCESKDLAAFPDTEPNAIRLALRSLEIILSEVIENDIKTCRHVNELVCARFEGAKDQHEIRLRVLRPETPLGFDSLDFEREDLDGAFARGRADAEAGKWQEGDA